MDIDWINYCTEEEYIDYDKYYESMAEKADQEWEDNCGED